MQQEAGSAQHTSTVHPWWRRLQSPPGTYDSGVPTCDATVARLSAVRHSHNLIEHHEDRAIAPALTTAPVFDTGRVATAQMRLRGNLASADVTTLRGVERPTSSARSDPNGPSNGSPVTLPPMSSDIRDDANAAIGGPSVRMRRGRTIVRHIAASRKRVDAVLMQRDPHAPIPARSMTDGESSEPQRERFSAVFAIGADTSGDTPSAVACAIRTVESVPGLPVDEFMVADFAGDILMVNLFGGAPICIPIATDSPKARRHVHRGYQTPGGTTALAGVRAQTGADVGDGSSASRIAREQQLAVTAREVITTNPLADIAPLLLLLDAATRSIDVNPELASMGTMARLAFNINGVPRASITSKTAPSTASATDPNPAGPGRACCRRPPLSRPQRPALPPRESSHPTTSLPSLPDAR
ncbi:cell envelope-related transcriptional attenuator domain protein [mine drainage metagenome]|uniref:Cell envelope-related transcriptional attenuator domain protein n=1 Tax=mine drainage metagenome TaxID=410659 RepID=A0A1J5RMT5_9ZZZZ